MRRIVLDGFEISLSIFLSFEVSRLQLAEIISLNIAVYQIIFDEIFFLITNIRIQFEVICESLLLLLMISEGLIQQRIFTYSKFYLFFTNRWRDTWQLTHKRRSWWWIIG